MKEIWYKEFRSKKERSLDLQQYRRMVEGLLCKGEYDESKGIPHKSMNDYNHQLFRSIMKHILWFIEDFEVRITNLETEISKSK